MSNTFYICCKTIFCDIRNFCVEKNSAKSHVRGEKGTTNRYDASSTFFFLLWIIIFFGHYPFSNTWSLLNWTYEWESYRLVIWDQTIIQPGQMEPLLLPGHCRSAVTGLHVDLGGGSIWCGGPCRETPVARTRPTRVVLPDLPEPAPASRIRRLVLRCYGQSLTYRPGMGGSRPS